jgi:UDP-glucose 4-epimerase
VVDNFSVGQPEDLGRVCAYKWLDETELYKWPDQVCLIKGDILDQEMMSETCSGADGVVHLAANTGVIPSIENPGMDCKTNVLGTLNLLESCRKSGVSRFVLASSGAPLGEQVPPIHENMVAKPISPYGASKLCGEAYCSAYHGSFDIETAALRFGNVYGPFSSHKGSIVAKFIKEILNGEPLTIYGDGNQTRDFIYIEDLCRAVWAALTRENIGGEIFQIATHQEHTVNEVAETLNRLMRQICGKKSEIRHASERKGEVRRNFSDISKARQVLGWEPGWEFEEGMKETVRWFVQQGAENATRETEDGG